MLSTEIREHRSIGQLKRFAISSTWNKGKTLTEKTKRKMSLAAKNRKREMLTAETKRKIGLALKGRRLSGEHKRNLRLATIMHPNRKFSNTKIEQKTSAELERRGYVRDIDFFQNFGIPGIKNVDFYLPKLNTVIECDGCFYHACKQHGNPEYHQYAITNDARNKKLLETAGYRVFRFWGHEIDESFESRIDRVFK